MSVCVVTKIPSPYQVELFDAISEATAIDLSVVYLRARDSDRSWASRPLHHHAIFLDSEPRAAASAISGADLAVFSWYRSAAVRRLMIRRSNESKAWCFWGERPGFRHKGALGMLYRRLRLLRLWRDHRVPIWGIGHWAIDAYRREFGERPFFHVPYVSNLAPFARISRDWARRPTTVLFSGSLIERKGIVDLLNAFQAIARKRGDVRLLVMGDGPLRPALMERHSGDPQITFLGFRDWDELAEVYSQADILCAPSHYDGWGLIVAEGMASGLPVVASTSVGSGRELIEVSRTGWTFRAKDIRGLQRTLELALDQERDRIRDMSALCRERSQPYDLPAGVDRFVGAVEGSLAKWNP